jgi:Raf kinase inhibitor-like YbhB/YbcL family protein
MQKSALFVCWVGLSIVWPYGIVPDEPLSRWSRGLQIYSPAFLENGFIPEKYTCDGENISPPLHIKGVSPKTLSLVLIMEDPDALVGDWVHWTVWNMEASTKVIRENSIPEGSVEGETDFQMPAWVGPCPRWGVHRYVFKIFALDIKLSLAMRATREELNSAMQGHILESNALVGLYGRDIDRAATENLIQRKFTN